ncbi:MAG TPA: 30S ribosomal protein S12 methylthiotransferase RimO [Anaerohalosphaeraceae bacterium]|nr:30S ribosomal protein S12 methylthiotransferase RimO [Anaerohalosphaeraceae bacterium]HOL30805.1 30S ribosomal protein S12 methylthiotransferase RimO [Anaerohalosphaeraceae bacterium]HOM76633.1 30S ribosomal protein S12 methylthiotransferase RimO [Anaerohalosphaeraceae bacterium]HPC63684.1 30S ribosomal protein S12 methylthiotransferase RimO [Anaerohalosphaeraceae bacterium]HPO69381.1 30S ribosomal protein S12 methylthiotransferase RimO [Anaerohalosphaeraceae bacterium]
MVQKNKKSISVAFVALGCPKNMVDSEVMLAQIGQAGFVLSSDTDASDVVVINTCGFIEPAKQEALEAIRHAVRQKKKGRIRKVIVAGCLSERMGQALADEVNGIDAVVGLSQRDQIASIIQNCFSPKHSPATKLFIEPSGSGIHDDRGRLLITPGHWAYLRISEGCSRKCSFCTIPSIRGKFRSKPMEMILDEARELVSSGAVELSIIAQDSSFYGRDIGLKDGLIQLIGRLETIEPLQWLRLMYLYPAAVDDTLIEAVAESRKVVRYIDMPIQHISNPILSSMRRADTKEHTIELVEKLRKAMPDIVLRTTVIVGYPGETEAQFEELLDFIRWAGFDALGCFPFYPEAGTPAADLPGQLPDAVKQERLDTLMQTQQELVFRKMDAQLGRPLTVLVDEAFDNQAVGRFYGQAPHIDSFCKIQNAAVEPGQFIQTRVIGRDGYDFIVHPL